MARGGTTPNTIARAANMGFYGIAFNSYLWDNDSPFDNFLKILDAYKENKLEI